MKKTAYKLLMILMILGFVIGLAILLYPLFSNVWNNYREEQLFEAYLAIASQPSDEENEDLSAEWQRAWDYNASLQPIIIPDSFVQVEDPANDDSEYFACLDRAGDGKMGYIYIPKIDVRIPIFHTTEDRVLEKGSGHLHGSSLPVGGEGSHAVLAAHRGLPGLSLFTDIDQLQVGDQFYIYVLDDVLAYEIDQILTVLPYETESLRVEEGKDLVTLVTCTPYGVNSHRLLVRGHRVVYEREKIQEQERELVRSANTNYALWVGLGIAATAAVLLLVWLLLRLDGEKKRGSQRGDKT